MGWLDFISSIFSPAQQGGASSAPIQFVEPDVSHYEKHAEHGNQRAEKIDQAQEAANEELHAQVDQRIRQFDSARQSQEQGAIERAMMETQQAQPHNAMPQGIETAFAQNPSRPSSPVANGGQAVPRTGAGLNHSR